MKKVMWLSVFICLILTSCVPSASIKENSEQAVSTVAFMDSQTVNTEEIIEVNSSIDNDEEDSEVVIKLVDYADYFTDANGCVVIYNVNEDCYSVYNEALAGTRESPCSTFKIVATLMGLKTGVLQDINTTMNYSGAEYPYEVWNHELTLEEAFQSSCVWYFRQVIDKIGQEEVTTELLKLQYGNCDVSEWDGVNSSAAPELNGFWLGSSLQISPMEQVDVLRSVFQYKSDYTQEQVDILKSIMLYDEVNGYGIYGKTGTKQNKEGWYVGVAEQGDSEYYFAVFLKSNLAEKKVSGNDARAVISDIFASMQ